MICSNLILRTQRVKWSSQHTEATGATQKQRLGSRETYRRVAIPNTLGVDDKEEMANTGRRLQQGSDRLSFSRLRRGHGDSSRERGRPRANAWRWDAASRLGSDRSSSITADREVSTVTWVTGTHVTWPAAPRKRPRCSAEGRGQVPGAQSGPAVLVPATLANCSISLVSIPSSCPCLNTFLIFIE